jgi:hypothetical protein
MTAPWLLDSKRWKLDHSLPSIPIEPILLRRLYHECQKLSATEKGPRPLKSLEMELMSTASDTVRPGNMLLPLVSQSYFSSSNFYLRSFQLDSAAAKNHQHSVANPYSQFQNSMTTEEVINDKKVTSHVRDFSSLRDAGSRLIQHPMNSLLGECAVQPVMEELAPSFAPRSLSLNTNFRIKPSN